MFKKILIANRGEIAVRIIKSLKEMGIITVAVYSEADSGALHREIADESILIGNSVPAESYLNQDKLIQAALDSGCDAIHPGYGFLSEKWEFNEKVRAAGLIFIGPNPEAMKLLGSKVQSRIKMIEAGVPICPGMKGSSTDINEFVIAASEIGFPVLVKASDGGGGKGMRVVWSADDLQASVEAAMRESISAFGSDVIFLEKYIESPRHIEFQVAGDKFGNAVHFYERECSIQRRHQKIIEETPSPILTAELRKKMGDTAVAVAKAANYDNVGTVEFLVDKNLNYYFLEVNARIQVEHPITEMTTGVDLVKLQVKLALSEQMPYKQEDIKQIGHSLECRIYAEDAENNFMPSPGKIHYFKEPTGLGVRYDNGVKSGFEVPIFYDPILAKLITFGENREDSRKKMIQALKDNVVMGVKTSIPYLVKILESEDYIAGNIDTSFLNTHTIQSKPTEELINMAKAFAIVAENNTKTNIAALNTKITESNPWLEIGKWEII
jgi:acetyl-CoA carboxylase biotin carboxylase subunit